MLQRLSELDLFQKALDGMPRGGRLLGCDRARHIGEIDRVAHPLRFKAAGSLGRVLASRGEYKDAVDWMERAIEAPPPSMDEGRSLLYDLADALERLGEHGRALAILLEVQADAGEYRDVADRIERLRGVLQGSSRA